jgi:LmbE family N-acetylglucosaminyl deacetylase
MLRQLLAEGHKARALALLAHCDDETILCGGLLARITARGGSAAVLVACGHDDERRAELREACRSLGTECRTLDYSDGALPPGTPPELVERMTALIREAQPELVITHEDTFDYNEEHRVVSRCAQLAAQKAGMSAQGHRPLLVIAGEVNVPIPFADYLVNVDAEMGVLESAMACHKSQLAAAHKSGYYMRMLHARARWRGVLAGCEFAMAFRRLALPVVGDVYHEPQAI